jgi:hypothetical protein
LIDKLGHDVVDVVISILCGGNVRAMTEKINTNLLSTMSNASMLMTFVGNFIIRGAEMICNYRIEKELI